MKMYIFFVLLFSDSHVMKCCILIGGCRYLSHHFYIIILKTIRSIPFKKNRILSENVIFHAYLRTIQETTSPVVSLATQLSSNVQHLTFMSKRTGRRDNLVKHPKLNPNND